MDRDVVCGAKLRPGEEAASITYAGQTYHFCSVECRKIFESSPKKYAAEAAKS
jgi:YHS domain-containing protein